MDVHSVLLRCVAVAVYNVTIHCGIRLDRRNVTPVKIICLLNVVLK